MKILGEERVTRYCVEFSDEETNMLQAVGMLPPHAARPARLYVTGEELASIRETIDTASAATIAELLQLPKDEEP